MANKAHERWLEGLEVAWVALMLCIVGAALALLVGVLIYPS